MEIGPKGLRAYWACVGELKAIAALSRRAIVSAAGSLAPV